MEKEQYQKQSLKKGQSCIISIMYISKNNTIPAYYNYIISSPLGSMPQCFITLSLLISWFLSKRQKKLLFFPANISPPFACMLHSSSFFPVHISTFFTYFVDSHVVSTLHAALVAAPEEEKRKGKEKDGFPAAGWQFEDRNIVHKPPWSIYSETFGLMCLLQEITWVDTMVVGYSYSK